jgi:hypothetical protein
VGIDPKTVGNPLDEVTILRARVEELKRINTRLIDEAQFVISGGDDPHDRCGECGCAGYGMLRDAITEAKVIIGLPPL